MDWAAVAKIAPRVRRQSLHIDIPSKIEWIEPTILFLQRHAVNTGMCDEQRAGRLLLVLHEALTNAIVHGNLEVSSDLKRCPNGSFAKVLAERSADPRYVLRLVRIEVQVDPHACHWLITDEGPGFDFARVMGEEQKDPEPVLPDEDDIDFDADDFDLDAILPSGRGLLLMKSFMDEVAFDMGGRRLRLTFYRTTERNRRLTERLPFLEQVRVIPLFNDGHVDWDGAFYATAANLSPGGVSFMHEAVPVARYLLIELSDEDDTFPILLPARIVHVRCVDDQVMHVGCAFDTNIPIQAASLEAVASTTADNGHLAVGTMPATNGHGHHRQLFERSTVIELVGTLLKQAQARQPSPSERREHQRHRYTGRVEVAFAADPTRRPVVTRDLSNGGMAFLSNFPLKRGPIDVYVMHGFGAPTLLRSEVARCIQLAEGYYDVGVRFVSWE